MNAKMSLVAKSPTWLVTLLIALSALAYVLVVFLPGQTSISALNRQLYEKRRQVVQSDHLIVPLTKEKERLQAIRAVADRWNQVSPGPQEMASLYARISEQAHRSDLQLVKFEPQVPRGLHTLRQYSIAISVHGGFPEIFDFFARLEAMPQTIWPTQIRIQKPEGMAASLQCDMTLSFFGDLNDSAD
jgi:Tfp pilus assembly protein PilO